MSRLPADRPALPVFPQGVPFPQNEANAMDVVVQFAIHRLGFQPQDIIIYAWSIGGFTGTAPLWSPRLLSLPRRHASGTGGSRGVEAFRERSDLPEGAHLLF